MSTPDLIAGKALALVVGAVSASTVALAEAVPSLPLEWTGILALIGAVFGYGRLSGRLEERQKAVAAQPLPYNQFWGVL